MPTEFLPYIGFQLWELMITTNRNNLFLYMTGSVDWKKMILIGNTPIQKTIHILYPGSVYHSQKSDIISQKQNGQFQFPVVHTIHRDGYPVFLYTDKKCRKGGFGVPKLVFNHVGDWNNKPLLDAKGKYGLSQNTFGIIITDPNKGKKMAELFTPEVSAPKTF